jgi:hypothetical protein
MTGQWIASEPTDGIEDPGDHLIGYFRAGFLENEQPDAIEIGDGFLGENEVRHGSIHIAKMAQLQCVQSRPCLLRRVNLMPLNLPQCPVDLRIQVRLFCGEFRSVKGQQSVSKQLFQVGIRPRMEVLLD